MEENFDRNMFMNWMDEFFTKKSNELQFSRDQQPKTNGKLVIDLSVAQVQPLLVNIPFKNLIVNKVYTTSNKSLDKTGKVKIMFNIDSLSAIDNAMELNVNDTLKSEVMILRAYLIWDSQADTTMELQFMPVVEVISGTSKTNITGTVYVDSAETGGLQVKSFPLLIGRVSYNNTSGTVYTVPAGKYVIMSIQGVASAGASCSASILTVNIFSLLSQATTTVSSSIKITLQPGTIVSGISSAATATISFYFEEYDI